ncbi:uncharacterized protein AMSG_05669 [Thecamonas trahens ATCC 50062]|uniref:MGS-like domain-containing protein n=1 Tax=Thecamonas trahens ATCC 50062 TaxID=461836 RepID=A0A0L0DBL9_THETB|nr:hypothetical protein AMSG_05669 [Thecamonas trahens ATCC 50062]KNC49625.1 hypothetical protein AMSG_05669 [Thecamonas trahens ATCC 50062]|eukprot:XP_013757730.1 hypothetical protein AMSG_05669 [Thecamonas trahens ATCC 50062]
MSESMVKRALVSVADKTGVVELCQALVAVGVTIVSTGGTARTLEAAGLAVTAVQEVTGFPEVFGGRVKTLHPLIHGGLLMRRSVDADVVEAAAHGIGAIDLVVCNLYPFETVVAGRAGLSDSAVTDEIDIGGVTMIRAAAKAFCEGVTVVVDPAQYKARVVRHPPGACPHCL